MQAVRHAHQRRDAHGRDGQRHDTARARRRWQGIGADDQAHEHRERGAEPAPGRRPPELQQLIVRDGEQDEGGQRRRRRRIVPPRPRPREHDGAGQHQDTQREPQAARVANQLLVP